jgi:uncharacterized protein
MKVLLAGGSGYLGRHISDSLMRDGHEVVVLTRRAELSGNTPGKRMVTWDARSADGAWVSELNGADGVINLAGTSIGGLRWTRRYMAEILSSRVAATAALVNGIQHTPGDRRPKVFVSASGIDYYGDRGDELITEESSPGDSFLAHVCQQWEAAATKAEALGVRVVRIRTSMVFGRGAPAFRLLVLPFRLFAGGPLGDGHQWFTWVHVDDLVRLYRLGIEDERLFGPVNAVAPDIRRERELAREIGQVMHRPAFVPAPAFALRLVLGQESQLLLHGRRALPAKARSTGFEFRLGGLRQALEDALVSR